MGRSGVLGVTSMLGLTSGAAGGWWAGIERNKGIHWRRDIWAYWGVCGAIRRWCLKAQGVSRLDYFCWWDSLSAVVRGKEMRMWLWWLTRNGVWSLFV